MQRYLLLSAVLVLFVVSALPSVSAEPIFTTGKDYDLVEDYTTGNATWTSHPERINDNGWKNYFLQTTTDKIMFRSNSVGGLVYDIPTCSYSLYEYGYNGAQIIPSVSVVGSYENNGAWSNLPVNQQSCNVSYTQSQDGIIITSTKELGAQKLIHEINVNVYSGIKETFRVWNDGPQRLGISQTAHTGDTITIGNQTINIAQYNGQSFDRQFLQENQAQIFEIADKLHYDFDQGFSSLDAVNIIFENNKYKVNMDYAQGNSTGYLEIDPTWSASSSSSGAAKKTGNGCANMSFSSTPESTVSTGTCATAGWSWNVSSLDNSAIVTDVKVTTSVTYSNNPQSCKIGSTSHPISTGIYNANDRYSSSSGICSGGQVTLNSNANTDLMADLVGDDYFSIATNFINFYSQSTTRMVHFSPSATLTVTYTIPPPAPDPPTGLALSQTAYNTMSLSWTASPTSSITGYKIERSTDNSNWTTLTSNTATTATTYTDTFVFAPNTTYYYRVFTYQSGSQNSGYSTTSADSSVSSWNVPSQVTGLAGQSGTPIVISWNAPSSDSAITSYKIYRNGAFLVDTGNTNLTYSDSNVNSGSTYSYTVSAVSAVGEGAQSSSVNVVAGVPPDPPTGLASSIPNPNPSPLQISLSWSAPANVGTGTLTGFGVYRDGNLVTTTGLTNSYTDTVPASGTYSYTVRAVSTHGTSSDSNTSSIATPTAPNQVTGLTVTPTSMSDISLSWSTPSSGGSAITGYKIERSLDGASWSVLIANTGSTGTSLTDSNLSSDTQYYYRVSAINNVGTGSASASANTWTMLSAPTNLSTTALSSSSIGLSWTAPSGNVLGYKIFSESPTGAGFSTLVANTANTNTSYNATNLGSATQYNFKVSAINSGGAGVSSGQSAMTTTPLAPYITSVSGQTASSVILAHASNSTGNNITLMKVQYQKSTAVSPTVITTNYASPYTLSGLDIASTYTVSLAYGSSGGYSAYGASSTASTSDSRVVSGGGGGGSTGNVNSIISKIIGTTSPSDSALSSLTMSLPNIKLTLDQSVTGDIDVMWDSSEDLQVQKIIIGDSPFRISFPQQPFVLFGDESGLSSAKIKYALKAPAQFCSADVVSACIDPKKYQIPVEFTIIAVKSGTVVKNEVISVNMGSSEIDLALFAVIGLIAVPVIGFGLRHKRGSGKKTVKEQLNLH